MCFFWKTNFYRFLHFFLVRSGWLRFQFAGLPELLHRGPKFTTKATGSTGGHSNLTPCRSPWTNAGRSRRLNPRWEFESWGLPRRFASWIDGIWGGLQFSWSPSDGFLAFFLIFFDAKSNVFYIQFIDKSMHKSNFDTSSIWLKHVQAPNFSGGIAGCRCAGALGDASWPGSGTQCQWISDFKKVWR